MLSLFSALGVVDVELLDDEEAVAGPKNLWMVPVSVVLLLRQFRSICRTIGALSSGVTKGADVRPDNAGVEFLLAEPEPGIFDKLR